MTTLTALAAVAVLLSAWLLAYVADRGLVNALERIGIACIATARRMRQRRECVAKHQAAMLTEIQHG